jgi:S1-C subfamily serine protease
VIVNTALQYNSERAAGTGMVINSDGLVLTNNHVIDDSTSITATIPATGKTYPATVLGYDKTGDIALIRLQGASGLATAPVGNASSVKAGDPVVALGNAGGQNTIAVAAGQVTALDQTITASDEAGSTSSETLHGMIETNAGQASSTVAIGYPPFLGIFVGSGSASSPQAEEQQAQQQYGSGQSPACSDSNAGLMAPSTVAPVASGVLVDGTICGSPAAGAGLTGGAVITAINGQSVSSPDQLSSTLARFHPGDTISVTRVSPAGQRTTSSIRLTAGPPQ